MSKRLFSYPADAENEAEGVRKLLKQHDIDFYESPGSRWGFSHASIWIKNSEDFTDAKSLFDNYQQEYAQQARLKYQQETGYQPDAPLPQRFIWALNRLLGNTKLIILLLIGFGLIYVYLKAFWSLFSPGN